MVAQALGDEDRAETDRRSADRLASQIHGAHAVRGRINPEEGGAAMGADPDGPVADDGEGGVVRRPDDHSAGARRRREGDRYHQTKRKRHHG
jgi:hypothetical protein